MPEPRLLLTITTGALLWGGSFSADADTLHVPGDFATIQEAIDAAADGDDVLVGPGGYPESLDMLGKAITLHSTDGAESTALLGDFSATVISCVSGETRATVIKGFAITGGLAATGGGMHNLGSDPTIIDCFFTLNTTIVDGVDVPGGGAMRNDNASPLLVGCTIHENTAAQRGAGMLNINGSAPTVIDCLFKNNHGASGAGMYNIDSAPVIAGCVFFGNSADPAKAIGGGAMINENSHPTITGCTFAENAATGGDAVGGAILNRLGSHPMISNCTFTDNLALTSGGAIQNLDDASPVMFGSELCGNAPDNINGDFQDCGDNLLAEKCAEDCAADLDGDGVVSTSDLIILLGAWGVCR